MNFLRSSILGLVLLSAVHASAVDAFNNLGSVPGVYDASSSYDVGLTTAIPGRHFDRAFQFIATATGTLSGLDLAMNNHVSPAGVLGGYTVSINQDVNGLISAPIATYQGVSTGQSVGTTSQALSIVDTSSASPLLIAGTTYWLYVTATPQNTGLAWNVANGGATTQAYEFAGFLGSYSTSPAAAFAVHVNPVPEPSYVVMGIGALGWLRRRRKARLA